MYCQDTIKKAVVLMGYKQGAEKKETSSLGNEREMSNDS